MRLARRFSRLDSQTARSRPGHHEAGWNRLNGAALPVQPPVLRPRSREVPAECARLVKPTSSNVGDTRSVARSGTSPARPPSLEIPVWRFANVARKVRMKCVRTCHRGWQSASRNAIDRDRRPLRACLSVAVSEAHFSGPSVPRLAKRHTVSPATAGRAGDVPATCDRPKCHRHCLDWDLPAWHIQPELPRDRGRGPRCTGSAAP